MTKTTISSKGQVAIPKAIRDRLDLKPGTRVALNVEGEQLVMKRLGTFDEPTGSEVAGLPDWKTMRGMVRTGPSLTRALEEEHRTELAREDERINRI
jgi:AbrB family looped-hinge helix DNA binding protein